MEEQEGVIQFNLEWQQTEAITADLSDLNAWREILWKLELVGQNPDRYGGYGYGNVSQRYTAGGQFIISGSQTGHLHHIDAHHYALITESYPETNRVVAKGPIRPSSESMTHGIIYQLDESANCVMHVHSPEIWNAASKLSLPVTRPGVVYGTPEMANEVRRLFDKTNVQQHGIFTMAGHPDGVIAFGNTAEAAGVMLIKTLARS